jgi:hypothetical protein
LRERIIDLAQNKRLRESKFWELGELLEPLKKDDPEGYEKVVDPISGVISVRAAYYFRAVSKRVQRFTQFREQLERVGWTKVQVISQGLNSRNIKKRLRLAGRHTARQLPAVLGDKPPLKTHCVMLHFTDRQYARFTKALREHGATPARRGLKNQEAAILHLIDHYR